MDTHFSSARKRTLEWGSLLVALLSLAAAMPFAFLASDLLPIRNIVPSEKVNVTVDEVVMVYGKPHGAFTLPDGYRAALPADGTGHPPFEWSVYRSVSDATPSGSWFHSRDGVYYSVSELNFQTLNPSAALAPLWLLGLLVLIPLGALAAVVYDFFYAKKPPSIRLRRFELDYNTDLFYRTVPRILGSYLPFASHLVANFLLFWAWFMYMGANADTGIIASFLSSILWTSGAFWLFQISRLKGLLNSLAARIFWGRARNFQCKGLMETMRSHAEASHVFWGRTVPPVGRSVWPLSWFFKQDPDMEVFQALGAFEYEGTLGDLSVAVKSFS